jgi:hypothetical protein
MQSTRLALAALAALALAVPSVRADSKDTKALDSLKEGNPELKSAGALAFGPDGVLFVGDYTAAAIYALDTGDRTASTSKDLPKVEAVNSKMASLLGVEADQLLLNDLAVNPISGNTYFSVMRGKGPDGQPVLLKMDRAGKLNEFALKGVKFAKVELPSPTTKNRTEAITQIAYVKGKVYVAGISSEEFTSRLRVIPFPFGEADKGTVAEIFHGSHGGLETKSPVRTFAPLEIKGETNLLAAYTCTPLVKFPVDQLKPGEKVRGVTVAELGNGNRPLDMIIYEKGGKSFVLMSNSKHGLLKIPTEGIESVAPISTKVSGTAGLKAEKVSGYDTNVVQLDQFDKEHALLLVKDGKKLNVETIELP